ncbi:MAG: DNA methyltransferase [Bryobacteraceae bacterium]
MSVPAVTLQIAISDLRVWPRNYREGDVDAIARSIKRFGLNGALRIKGDYVYAGNHVYKALVRMKEAGEDPPIGVAVQDDEWLVPAISLGHLTEAEAKAFAVTDNRTYELGTSNLPQLAELLLECRSDESLLTAIPYDDADIAQLLREIESPKTETEQDEVPEPVAEAECRVKPGDIWVLGGHRIMCGDSSNSDDVAALMDGQKASLFSTDPPYFVDYTGDNRPSEGKDWSHLYNEISASDAPAFMRKVFQNAIEHTHANAGWYVWHADVRRRFLEELWEELDILFHQTVIWVKPIGIMTYNTYHFQHEPCMHGWRRGNRPLMVDTNKARPSTVWNVDYDGKNASVGKEHPTQKPLELFAIPIRTHTLPGDIVLELFSGSGSNLVAAEQLGRRCYAMELQPVFVDVAIRRWEAISGQQAELDHRRG